MSGQRGIRWLWMAASAAFLVVGAVHWIDSRTGRRSPEAAAPASRVVSLLGFHDAQDRGDLDGMLNAAARLEAAGEAALGRHVRNVASWAVRSGWVPDPGGWRSGTPP